MTDADRPDDLADGEVLAAYLDGATDEVTTARLERRLATDPALAARLDGLVAVRARLQRLSQVAVPDEVRQRLRTRLAEERETAAATALAGDERAARRRRWVAATAPRLAVAVVVLVAVLVLGTAAVQLLGGVGASDSAESAGLGASAPAMAADPDAGGEVAQDRANGDNAQQESATSGGAGRAEAGGSDAGAGGSEPAVAAPDVPAVERDQQLIDRARRQEPRTPRELRARERRLRRRAGLPTDRLCVSDLDARTVDLVERDGRLVLATLVGSDDAQVVVTDPRTCAPQRAIPLAP